LAVSVNIPGFGEVTAQNAAQDDTLNRIASILTDIASKQGAKVSTGSIKALDRESKKAAGSTRKAASSVENLGARSGDASSSIYGLTTAANTVKSAFAKASSGMTSGKETFGSGLDIMAGMLKSGGELFQSVVKDIPVASLAGSLAALATGAGAAILAIVSQTAKSFQALQQSGGSFGYSLEAVRDQANAAGLRLDQFQNVFAKNAKVFASFGGSTQQGAAEFAKLNLAVRNGTKGFGGVSRQLLRMGIGFEEQAEGVAEALQQFKLAGFSMSDMSTRSAQVGRYQVIQAKQLKMLTQLNGTTLEQEKAKQKAMRDDATNRMILSKYTGDDRLKVEAAMKQAESLMVGGGKLFLQQMESGGPMTSGMAMMAMQYPEFAKQTGLMAQGIKGGRLSLEDTSTFMARNMDDAAHAADSQRVGATAGVLALAEISNGYVDSAKKLFVHGENLGLALKHVTEIFEDFAKLAGKEDSMTRVMLDAQEAQQKISRALSIIATNLSASDLAREIVLDPITSGAEWLTKLAEAGADVTKGWREGLIPTSDLLTTQFGNLFPDWLKTALGALSPAKPKPEGAKMLGGPINAGGSYMVGERGPELITPSMSGFVTPSNKLFALMQDSVEAAMADMRSSTQGATALTDQTPTMTDEMLKFTSSIKQGGDEGGSSRKRDVEDAMLALPGLLMDNTDAITKANVDTTDSLDVFYRALA
jgi:hypothetical protein